MDGKCVASCVDVDDNIRGMSGDIVNLGVDSLSLLVVLLVTAWYMVSTKSNRISHQQVITYGDDLAAQQRDRPATGHRG